MKIGRTSSAVKNKYNAKVYDRITIVVKKGMKDAISKYAASRGESTNAFIISAINEIMEKEKSPDK